MKTGLLRRTGARGSAATGQPRRPPWWVASGRRSRRLQVPHVRSEVVQLLQAGVAGHARPPSSAVASATGVVLSQLLCEALPDRMVGQGLSGLDLTDEPVVVVHGAFDRRLCCGPAVGEPTPKGFRHSSSGAPSGVFVSQSHLFRAERRHRIDAGRATRWEIRPDECCHCHRA
jgi:hypothetical protein